MPLNIRFSPEDERLRGDIRAFLKAELTDDLIDANRRHRLVAGAAVHLPRGMRARRRAERAESGREPAGSGVVCLCDRRAEGPLPAEDAHRRALLVSGLFGTRFGFAPCATATTTS